MMFRVFAFLLASNIFVAAKEPMTSEKRSHNHGPEWPDHCWNLDTNHIMDPFCPQIRKTNCNKAPEITHGSHKQDYQRTVGSTIVYYCNEGYFLSGPEVVTCIETVAAAHWTDTPVCNKVGHMGISHCDDIAIIGAGITGSYAAWRLRHRNLNISLYEYSNRIGGRCFTVQLPDIPDVNVEMGAMRFIPDEHHLTNKTVHDLGLEVVDFELGYGATDDSLYYLRGKHIIYSELPTKAPYNFPPGNRIDRRTLNWHVFNNFTISSQNGDVLKSLDGVDLYNQRHSFYYNHHFKSIKRQANGTYILTFQRTKTIDGITSDVQNSVIKACAKKVILAIPRLALEHLDWDGLRQETIQDYLKHSLKDIHASKIFFGYDNAWWKQLSKATRYAVSMTPLRQSYDFGVSKTTSKGVLNPGYTDGDTRLWREAMGSGEFVRGVGDNSIAMTNVSVYLTRKYYAETFNIAQTDVPEPKSAVMTVWDQYPIGASCNMWAPGYKKDEVESRMMKPSASDDVYIASNTFSSNGRSGWIQGGMEMVEKVLQYFK